MAMPTPNKQHRGAVQFGGLNPLCPSPIWLSEAGMTFILISVQWW